MSKDNGTPVKCLDCGHEWNTTAQYPQCSDPDDECGRSRNVEPIAELNSSGGESAERDSEPSGDSQTDSSWSPLFDAEQTETEPVEDMSISEAPEIDGESIADSMGESDPEESPEFEEAEVPELEADDIRFFVKTPFDMASRTRGEHWELNDDELDQLSHAYARVGNKYAPYMLAEHAPEVMALMATMAVVGPRVAQDKKEAEKSEKEQTDDDAKEATDRRNDSPARNEQADFAYSKV